VNTSIHRRMVDFMAATAPLERNHRLDRLSR